MEDSVDRNVDVVVTQFANQDAAKGMVNKWVSEKTNQKITNVQLAITPDTRV